MYDRGRRLLTQPTGSTVAKVGPGTYNVDHHKKQKLSYAPFHSMTPRESFMVSDAEQALGPGPTHYTPQLAEHVRGGDSVHTKTRRFHSRLSGVPGPGSYTLSKKSDWLKNTHSKTPSKAQEKLGLITTGKLTLTRKSTAPSIPIPGHNCGYEEDDKGRLTPQALPPSDPSIGPAYYHVSHEATAATNKYKGVHFGNMQSTRLRFQGREGPGPGEYDPAEPKVPSQPTTVRTLPTLPRYIEQHSKQEEKKAIPGPGQYNIKSQFQNSGQGNEEEEEEEKEPISSDTAPFGSRLQRFISPKHQSPAPTTYQDSQTALHLKEGWGTGLRAPFGQSSLRFKDSRLAKHVPGPGTYNNSQMTSMAADVYRKSQYHGVFQCPFGTTSVRTVPLAKKDAYSLPGPAHYQKKLPPEEKVKGETEKGPQPSYTFSSTTSRLYSPPKIVADLPPPGSYNVSESYDKLHDWSPGNTRYVGEVPKGAFLSSTLRFAPTGDMLTKNPDSSIPGPGEYDCKESLGQGKPGLIYSKDKRFKDNRNKIPGPGAYTLSKTYKDTLLHTTHNVTLNNPITEQENSKAPPTKLIFS